MSDLIGSSILSAFIMVWEVLICLGFEKRSWNETSMWVYNETWMLQILSRHYQCLTLFYCFPRKFSKGMYWQLTNECPVARRSPGVAPSPMACPRPPGTITRPWCTRPACSSLADTPGTSTPTPTWPTGTTSGNTSLPRASGPSASPPSQEENLWRGERLHSDFDLGLFLTNLFCT